MKTRILTAAIGLVVLAVVLLFFNTPLFDLVVAAVCLIGVHEAFAAMGFGKKQWYLYVLAIPYTLLVMLSNGLPFRAMVLPATFILMLILCCCLIANSRTLDFGKLSGYLFFSAVIVLCFYSLVYLKRCLPVETYQYDAIYFILLTLCFAWGGDSTAYFVGRFFGKHKLAPVVSPNKTVEGAVGGVLGSVVLGVAATAIYQAVSGRFVSLTVEVNVKHYLLIALLGVFASILGILGDLFASAIKRQVGLKDYGTIFPGHGGILDRFDSVMFVAPFVAFIVRYFFYFLR